jgi:Amidohydrolase family
MRSPDFSVAERWAQVRSARAGEAADLLVRDCRIVNVYSGEVHPGDIAVRDGIIVAIRENYPGHATRVLDAGGRFAVPGLVVSHGLPDSRPAPRSAEGQAGLVAYATSVVRDVTAGECDGESQLPQRQWTASRLGLGKLSQVPAVAHTCGDVLRLLRSGFPAFLHPGPGQGTGSAILGQVRDLGADIRRACLGRWIAGEGGMEAAIHVALEVMRSAAGIGLAPAEACALATLNPAIVFGVDHRVGSITPGRFADFWLAETIGAPGGVEVILGGQPAGPRP